MRIIKIKVARKRSQFRMRRAHNICVCTALQITLSSLLNVERYRSAAEMELYLIELMYNYEGNHIFIYSNLSKRIRCFNILTQNSPQSINSLDTDDALIKHQQSDLIYLTLSRN